MFSIFPHLAKNRHGLYGVEIFTITSSGTKNLNLILLNFLGESLLERFKYLVTHLEGDYDLAKKWYEAKGKYIYSFMYQINLYKTIDLNVSKNDTVSIQIGIRLVKRINI